MENYNWLSPIITVVVVGLVIWFGFSIIKDFAGPTQDEYLTTEEMKAYKGIEPAYSGY